MRHTYLLVLVVLVITQGCSSSSTQPETAPTPTTIRTLFPLAVGNSWTYQVTNYDANTGAVSQRSTYTTSIDSAVTINGQTAYKYGSGSAYQSFSGNDLQYSYTPSGRTGMITLVRYRYPMLVGTPQKVLDTTYSDQSRQVTTLEIVDSAKKVTVPAGTFTCVQFRTVILSTFSAAPLDTAQVTDDYLAPGVGLVRTAHYRSNRISEDNLLDLVELKSYTVK
ncbi:MAG: hypothetical protein JSS75_01550 [Bacteroidetes bacterium]|nr:hypothetical protein [Bacteroidota bacterium]